MIFLKCKNEFIVSEKKEHEVNQCIRKTTSNWLIQIFSCALAPFLVKIGLPCNMNIIQLEK